MNIKPIPKKLLVHSVEYKEFLGNNGWDDEWGEPMTINYVLVRPATSVSRDSLEENILANSILIIDRINSSPYVDVKEKSKVKFEGVWYDVNKVNKFYTFSNIPHHLEVELI